MSQGDGSTKELALGPVVAQPRFVFSLRSAWVVAVPGALSFAAHMTS
jgi:hypothetical protein